MRPECVTRSAAFRGRKGRELRINRGFARFLLTNAACSGMMTVYEKSNREVPFMAAAAVLCGLAGLIGMVISWFRFNGNAGVRTWENVNGVLVEKDMNAFPRVLLFACLACALAGLVTGILGIVKKGKAGESVTASVWGTVLSGTALVVALLVLISFPEAVVS